MRDIILFYVSGNRLVQATVRKEHVERYEAELGTRLLGKVVLEAR